jgi:hydroxymethylglutaryl-CoA synthase
VARGILGWGAYLPYRRLDRTTIAAVAGGGGGKGARTVASYDEDATTMAVEAARVVLRSTPDVEPSSVWFATTSPPYLDKTNAAAIHAALRLGRSVPAFDAGGAVRSAMGALRAGFHDVGASLVVASDVRTGLPGSPDETAAGDGAAALLVGEGDVVAELLAWGAVTEEFVDRWRTPGDVRSKTWEERFGETRYTQLGIEAWEAALKQAGVTAGDVDHLIVASTHDRAAKAVAKKLGVAPDRLTDDLSSTVGNTGAAAPALLLAVALEKARPGQVIALVVLADGADAVILRTTAALADRASVRPVADQVAAGGAVPYGKYLAWRGLLPVQPPNRPEPARPSSSAAGRSIDWKYGFVGSERGDGSVHLPPSPHDGTARPMSEATGTIVTFTIDKLAYSPSPPVVFAVVDFDGGGRLPVELTDVDPDEVAIGARVEMTFRKLFTADGIHNYFWKARLVR